MLTIRNTTLVDQRWDWTPSLNGYYYASDNSKGNYTNCSEIIATFKMAQNFLILQLLTCLLTVSTSWTPEYCALWKFDTDFTKLHQSYGELKTQLPDDLVKKRSFGYNHQVKVK